MFLIFVHSVTLSFPHLNEIMYIFFQDGKYTLSLQIGEKAVTLACPSSPPDQVIQPLRPAVDVPHYATMGPTNSVSTTLLSNPSSITPSYPVLHPFNPLPTFPPDQPSSPGIHVTSPLTNGPSVHPPLAQRLQAYPFYQYYYLHTMPLSESYQSPLSSSPPSQLPTTITPILLSILPLQLVIQFTLKPPISEPLSILSTHTTTTTITPKSLCLSYLKGPVLVPRRVLPPMVLRLNHLPLTPLTRSSRCFHTTTSTTPKCLPITHPNALSLLPLPLTPLLSLLAVHKHTVELLCLTLHPILTTTPHKHPVVKSRDPITLMTLLFIFNL